MTPAPALSVLDLVPVPSGSTPEDALQASLRLARRAEELGYTRYWVAEHHNMPGIASSSPAVLIAHLATVTETIRVGSGGVMLPNHAPLVIAEQFGTLAAFHPGRIDLGIGRAPGTDPATAAALRRVDDRPQWGARLSAAGETSTSHGAGPALSAPPPIPPSADEFPNQLAELLAFLNGEWPEGHPYEKIRAVPHAAERPSIWLLGSSDYSAQVAAHLGRPFSFAHHFSPQNTLPALESYRRTFRPSQEYPEPYAMVAVSVVCAEADERARFLAGPTALSFLLRRTGRRGRLPSPEEAAEYNYTPFERQFVDEWMATHIVGSPSTVRRGLDELAARTGADELMITTIVHGSEDRLRSYELVAEAVR